MKRNTPAWGKEVKKTLIDRDMKITELAEVIGLSRSHVTNIINGVFVFPEIQQRICDYLGIETKED